MIQVTEDLYRCADATAAERLFKRLTSWMMHSHLEPMKKVARSLREHKDGIPACCLARTSNAFAEGMNSLIQTARRKARGFRTFRGFRTMIYLAVGRLQLA